MNRNRLTSVVLALLFSLVLVEGVPAQTASFTIEQVMSAPFPTGMIAAPSGGNVAWVYNDQGERNIWVAGPPSYEGRKLTDYRGDDGQEVTSLAWSPDGESIAFVYGGNTNRQGEYPNPLSNPAGIEQEVWVVSVDSGELHRLGEGRSPAVSPRDDRVAFLNKGQIWWAPLDGSSEAEQLVQARGTAGDLRWSPDGSRLAFVSDRGDHEFIAVYNWESKSVSFLDPSVDHDSNPVWSPDGSQIAFIRKPECWIGNVDDSVKVG